MWANINRNLIVYCVILSSIAVGYWFAKDDEDDDDPYILWIDYDCRIVIKDPNKYSMDILNQCKQIIEDHDASKRSKHST